MTNYFSHELLDRLYLISDMYYNYIVEHETDDLTDDGILSKDEKEKMCKLLWDQYQLVGARIAEREENEGK